MKVLRPVIAACLFHLLTLSGCASHKERTAAPLRESIPEVREASAVAAAGRGGGVQVLGEGTRYFREGRAQIDYRIDDPGPVERVDLWTTTTGGKEWELAGQDADCRSPIEFKAPDGEYGIRVAAAVRDQPPPPAPRAGDPPQARVVLDTVPPEIQIGEARVVRLRTLPGRLGIELPFKVSDLHVDPAAVRLEWRAGSDRWIQAAIDAASLAAGRASFNVPAAAADPLSVRITAADLAGNASSRIEEVHPLEQIDPPRLELLSLDDGGIYRGGSTVEVRFNLDWARALPGGIALGASIDGGRTWQPVASGLHPGVPFAWKIPMVDSSQMLIELSARGACGFRAVRRSRPFRVDSAPPTARILGPRAARGRLVRLQVRATDPGPAGVDHLDLYEALPEGEVRKVREYPPGDAIEFETTRAGEIGLWLAATDRAGNSSPVPSKDDPPAFLLEMETPDGASPAPAAPQPGGPALSLLNFQGGAYRGGDRRYVFWSFAGALPEETSIDIESSGDGGKSWSRLASGIPARDGQWAWTLPREPGAARRMSLRLSAPSMGKSAAARSESEFVVESRQPRADFRGPRTSRSPRTFVRYSIPRAPSAPEAGKAPSPEGAAAPPAPAGTRPPEAIAPTAIVRVECWLRREGEARWSLAGKAVLEPGEGMPDADPAPGPVPDPPGEPPAVKADVDRGEAPDADEPGKRSLPIFVEDGRYEVFLLAEDAVGNRSELPEGSTHGPRLLVDTVRPRLQVTVPEAKDIYDGGEVVSIRIQAEDENLGEFPVRVETAEGHLPPAPGKEKAARAAAGEAPGGEGWSMLARWFPRSGTFSYPVAREPGERRIRVSAQDLAGNISERVLRFAVAPPSPRARLLGLERPVSMRAGEPLVIRWETRGIGSLESADGKVAIQSSRDGGRTWSDIVRSLPNSGVYTWSTPAEDIPDLRIRIEATGAAGQPASAESAPITVSARLPRVTLESVEPASISRPSTGAKRAPPASMEETAPR